MKSRICTLGVFGVDVNTTDVELYGNSYAGCVSAAVSHLCLFGLAGRTFNSPPDVSGAHPSIEYLWPANHKFVDVTIEGITDPDGDEVGITITGITSDENPCLPRAEKHTPDAYGVGTDTAVLRAERLGKGNGRVYEISFLADDGNDGQTTGTVKVFVPHSAKKAQRICIDDGRNYDATVSQQLPEPGPAR